MSLNTQLLQSVKHTHLSIQKQKSLLQIYSITQYLHFAITSRNYIPSRFSCFTVLDPTPREIFAPDFSDRIIHHFLIDNIESCIDKKFIYSSFANRKYKGTHKAINYLQMTLQKQSSKYYLQIDIKSFFVSIDKYILYKIVKNHLHNISISKSDLEMYLYLSEKIIFHDFINPSPIFTGDKKLLKLIPKHKSMFYNTANKGLPIGSLSSQFFANIYLNELDQFAKHILKIKYYIRYVDDIVIVGKTKKELLNYKNSIQKKLQDSIKLKLHPDKIILKPTQNGIDFLGYVTRKDYILVRNRTVKSFKKKLYTFNKELDPLFDKKHIQQQLNFNRSDLQLLQLMLATINSYYGIFYFADSYKLRKNLYHKHFKYLKNYFEPIDDECKSMKIKRGVYF